MDLLSIEEVSALTRVPVATLRFYRTRGVGGPRSARIAGRVRYRRADVVAWVDAQFAAGEVSA